MSFDDTCIVDDCSKPQESRGYCGMHRYRLKKHGSTELPAKKTCSIGDCGRVHYGHGLCNRHYKLQRYKNTPRDKKHEKDWQLRINYGITLEDYNRMSVAQNGVCKICGKIEKHQNKSLSVDHCHDTGIIRGLLCADCNTGIGFLGESVDVLEAAIKYIQEHQKCRSFS